MNFTTTGNATNEFYLTINNPNTGIFGFNSSSNFFYLTVSDASNIWVDQDLPLEQQETNKKPEMAVSSL